MFENQKEEQAREEILEKVQELYNSNFIYEVTFSSVLYQ